MKRRFLSVIAVFAVILGVAGHGGAFAQGAAAAGKFTPEQYKKALWMVTRFYGAQRSGVGPNWLLIDHTYKTSFTNDADGTHNLEGGWFDCGDHVLFGQTFFYSAYMLAKAYDAFPRGFHDRYNGKDYSDYADAGKWGYDDGKPNTIPDLLEELKYATDWIIKATPNGTTFYYEKGEGDKDHKHWVTAGKMSEMPANDGGEPRKMWKNPIDGPMASFAAASLAIMSRVYRKYDAAYADTCLNHAKFAYAYAKAHKDQAAGAGSGSYYGAGKVPENTFNIAAAEMFIATNDNTYKTDISLNKNNVPFHNWAFDYQNPHDMVPYAVAMAVPADRDDLLDKMRSTFITRFVGQTNSEKVATTGNDTWGALRYPANHAFLAALYQAAKGTTEYDQFIYNQVDYILGENTSKQSFVVGFCEGCSKQATKPHHRNVYLNDGDSGSAGMAKLVIPERNKSFGYMVGGSFSSSSYQDNINSYQYTEGGLDYNAGLVGALAYIVSKLDPADTSKFGIVEPPPPVLVPTTLKLSLSNNPENTAAYLKDTVSADAFYGDGDPVPPARTVYAHILDQNGDIMGKDSIVCDSVKWVLSYKVSVAEDGTFTGPDSHYTGSTPGCSLAVPFRVPLAIDVVTEMAAVEAVYAYAGISIRASVRLYPPYPVPPISVLPRNTSLAKRGYAITVKPGSVIFSAANGMEITKLSIYNIQGKRIFNSAGASPSITWNRASRPHGMYFVRMAMSNGVVVQRNIMIK